MREHPDLIEADLSRYHHLDLRDLWRFEPVVIRTAGRGRRVWVRRLTLRMIYVRIRHGLPPESALAIHFNGGKWPWKLQDHLLADLWYLHRQELEGKKAKDHPGRPTAKRAKVESPERARKMRDARRRAAAEQARKNWRSSGGG